MKIVNDYDPNVPLEQASTIPSSWYVNKELYELELKTVFSNTWQLAGRLDQLSQPGQYVTTDIGGEPIVVVRGSDGLLRAFYNVCRHHAAAVMTETEGKAAQLRCPYHGWTYSLEGELKGTPDFSGVCGFDRASNGLARVQVGEWEGWVFVKLDESSANSLEEFLTTNLIKQITPLHLSNLHWFERRHYQFDCNWKVFVDNYLDGGYHVPYLHKGLDSVLDYSNYKVENGERHCLQWSPLVSDGAEAQTGAVRTGDRALYYWIYPNFMINWYDGVMDTNLVVPRGVDQTEVIFDFYFPDIVSPEARERNAASVAVGQRIQDEDVAICKSVQRGLNSRAYTAGRLSVRREAGEHLFHRLLYADLSRQNL
ncbi:MAG: aromatic ring-hydroxylating dioxygenase subunit alpha [Acidobacteria bacterium]|nr:aromatic ring-hydroxylating dioxygenase subunit alpha [Acidobacteriota bacterium]MCA1627637.1 aromatic ring-hydroxylating dioxygenase subunit alpha [Acidobacteriota bacterium]